jgi:hypothetical protein
MGRSGGISSWNAEPGLRSRYAVNDSHAALHILGVGLDGTVYLIRRNAGSHEGKGGAPGFHFVLPIEKSRAFPGSELVKKPSRAARVRSEKPEATSGYVEHRRDGIRPRSRFFHKLSDLQEGWITGPLAVDPRFPACRLLAPFHPERVSRRPRSGTSTGWLSP